MKKLILILCAASALAQVRDTYPRTPPTLTVAAMTALSSPPTNMRVTVSDGANSTDCTTGGGSTVVDCRYTGSAWTVAPGGSGGSSSKGLLWAFWETSGMAQALTRYVTIGSNSGHTSESSRQQNLPHAGTVKNLHIRTITNVGGTAQTFIATVRKNGADTAITCTINTGSNTCTDLVNSVSFAQSDLFSVKYVTSATETNVLYPSFTLTLE